VFSLAPYINENIITLIGICLLIGAMAKSSQVGLHVWLPMAICLVVNNLNTSSLNGNRDINYSSIY